MKQNNGIGLTYQSFHSHGLFNAMPKHIRNVCRCGVEEFKEELDQFLTNIPNQPKIGGLIPGQHLQPDDWTAIQLLGRPNQGAPERPGHYDSC